MFLSNTNTESIIENDGFSVQIHAVFMCLGRHLAETLVYCSGKYLAGWKVKYRDEIYGGYPPKIDDITTEPEKSQLFIKILFLNKPMNDSTKK